MSYERKSYDWRRRQAIRDLLAAAGISIVVALLAHAFGLFEALASWSQAYERRMLDEFILVSAILVSALSIFSFLRWREFVQEAASHKQTGDSLRERGDQLALVSKIVEQMNADLELENVLNETIHLIHKSFDYHHVALYIADQEQGKLLMRAKAGNFAHLFPSDHRLTLDRGMVGWVYRHGETLLANDVKAEPHYYNPYPDLVPTQSELSVPILVSGQCVGVLDAQSPQIRSFEPNDVMVMETLAHQIALKVENVRLYEEIERKTLEDEQSHQALWESERRFRSIAETASDAIIIFDENRTIFFWNPAAKAIFGYEAGETRGKLLPSLVSEQFHEIYQREKEGKAGESDLIGKAIETTGFRRDGSEFPLEISLATWSTPEKKFFTMIARDITERVRSEQERARAEEALKQKAQELARSNSELEQFAYIVSHDLQEPLRMVRSYLQLLERRHKERLDEEARGFISYAVDGAARMRRLISDLLTYSRVTTHARPLTRTDCSHILDFALTDLKIAIEESDAVVTHDPLPTVAADETQLKQVFQNLISNGIKFHKENSRPEIHVGVEQQDEEWVFAVSDNGIGIDPQYFEQIFIIFQRLHSQEEYPGTGIGLALCKKIVERHGGRMWVESEAGQGSTFYFTIPKREGAHLERQR